MLVAFLSTVVDVHCLVLQRAFPCVAFRIHPVARALLVARTKLGSVRDQITIMRISYLVTIKPGLPPYLGNRTFRNALCRSAHFSPCLFPVSFLRSLQKRDSAYLTDTKTNTCEIRGSVSGSRFSTVALRVQLSRSSRRRSFV